MVSRYYSCDSHVVELPVVFDGLDAKYGERAPRIIHQPEDKGGVVLLWPSIQRGIPVGRFGIAGHRLDDPKTSQLILKGWDGMNPGVADPAIRLKEQDQDGIVGEVMYPSLNMLAFAQQDREVVQSLFQRHNDWIRDYCSVDSERLIGIGCLPLPDVEPAIAELQRGVKLGLRGFAIPCTAPADRPYSDPSYEPFWSAAEEAGLPLTMHVFTGAESGMGLPAHWDPIVAYTLAHAAIWNTASNIITSGVVERHPGLRFVLAEWETGWIAHVLERWDHAVYRTPDVLSKDLTMTPREYFNRNFWVTFEDDAIGIETRDGIGVDNLLWGNDYPHHDAIWPNSRPILKKIMDGVPEDEVEKMVWSNVQGLYNLDEAKLPA